MSFASPPLLAGLALVPALLAVYVMRERRVRRRSGEQVSAALRQAVLPRRMGWRRHVPALAGLVAAAILLAALARPQTTVAVPVQQARVIVMTDRSGSMLAKDVAPTRLEAARHAAEDFLDSLPDNARVGAIAFNQAPTVLASPTLDHDAARAALESITAAGTTATGDALEQALVLLRSGSGPAAIVLLSDGHSVRGRDVLAVAREAKAAKVPVYTVALGTAAGTITTKDGTSKVPPDPETMRQVAQITGGKAYSIGNASELRSLYRTLASRLATKNVRRDVTASFAGGALVVLLLGGLLGLRLTGRLV